MRLMRMAARDMGKMINMATKWMRALLAVVLLGMAAAVGAAGFSFQDTDGRKHSLAGYKGKWVLVNFWATWCPPCLEEIPDLVDLHDRHKDKDLVVLGVALDYRNPQQVKDFADQMFISYPVILGSYDSAAQVGKVSGLPTTYLFNPQGKMVAYNVGAITSRMVENYISTKK